MGETPETHLRLYFKDTNNMVSVSRRDTSNSLDSKSNVRTKHIRDRSPLLPRMNPKQKIKMLNQIEQLLARHSTPQIPWMHCIDILGYLKSRQFKFVISEAYLKNCTVQGGQPGQMNSYINRRSFYIDFMYETIRSIKHNKSLTMCVHLFDKLVEMHCKHKDTRVITEKELHIIVCTAILVSGKFCEIYPELMTDVLYIINYNVDIETLQEKESELLIYLDWGLNYTSEITYFELFAHMGVLSPEEQFYCRYALQLGLTKYDLCEEKPSLKAVAVLEILAKGTDSLEAQRLHDRVVKLTELRSDDLKRVKGIYVRLLQMDKRRPGPFYMAYLQKQFHRASMMKIRLPHMPL